MLLSVLEIASKRNRDGRRRIKVSLHEIYPDNTQWNDNGISWLEEQTKANLNTVIGSSITCEFLDEQRSEIAGHGYTGGSSSENLPVFENATMVGVFDNAYIQDIVVDGVSKKVLVGEGYIDELRYSNFVQSLIEKRKSGETIFGSVEILGTEDFNLKIQYLNNVTGTGRIPEIYRYVGYAILSATVSPADTKAQILQLNQQQKEEAEMDEKILSAFVTEIKSAVAEVCSKNAEYEQTISEKETKITELNASVAELTAALETVKTEIKAADEKYDTLWKEAEVLRTDIAKAKVAARLGELNSALAEFTEEEQKFAETEINSFKEKPMEMEINAITNKILAEIGKKAKEAARVAETNSRQIDTGDIFGEMQEVKDVDTSESDLF